MAGAEQPGGDFRFEVEAHGTKANRSHDVALEDFVGGFHVGQAAAEEDIGQHRERAVGEPGSARKAFRRIQESRSVDHVALTGENRSKQFPVLFGVQLEIGILHEHDIPGREREAVTHGRAFSQVDRILDDPDARVLRPAALLEHPSRIVGRSIVGHDDFALDGAKIHGEHAVDDLVDRALFVVDRNDDRQLHLVTG